MAPAVRHVGIVIARTVMTPAVAHLEPASRSVAAGTRSEFAVCQGCSSEDQLEVQNKREPMLSRGDRAVGRQRIDKWLWHARVVAPVLRPPRWWMRFVRVNSGVWHRRAAWCGPRRSHHCVGPQRSYLEGCTFPSAAGSPRSPGPFEMTPARGHNARTSVIDSRGGRRPTHQAGRGDIDRLLGATISAINAKSFGAAIVGTGGPCGRTSHVWSVV